MDTERGGRDPRSMDRRRRMGETPRSGRGRVGEWDGRRMCGGGRAHAPRDGRSGARAAAVTPSAAMSGGTGRPSASAAAVRASAGADWMP